MHRERLSPIRTVSYVGREGREREPSSDFAYLFPGQGKPEEIVQTAKKLFEKYSLVRGMYRDASNVLGFNLIDVSFNDDRKEELRNTNPAQSAIFVGTMVAYEVYKKEHGNAIPKYVAGHSVGQFAAAVASGAVSFLNMVEVIGVRQEAMQGACYTDTKTGMPTEHPTTGMTALIVRKENAQELEENLREFFELEQFKAIDLCLKNSRQQVVIGGPLDDLKIAGNWFKEHKVRPIALKVSGAFHSRYMTLARDAIAEILERTVIQKAKILIVGNGGASMVQYPQEIRYQLTDQTNSIYDMKGILDYLSSQGMNEAIELGHDDLSKTMQNIGGGNTESIMSRLGVFVGSRWKSSPQLA